MLYSHLITKKGAGHFTLYIGKSPCARGQISFASSRHRRMSVFQCISLFGVGMYFLSHCLSGMSEYVLWADT